MTPCNIHSESASQTGSNTRNEQKYAEPYLFSCGCNSELVLPSPIELVKIPTTPNVFFGFSCTLLDAARREEPNRSGRKSRASLFWLGRDDFDKAVRETGLTGPTASGPQRRWGTLAVEGEFITLRDSSICFWICPPQFPGWHAFISTGHLHARSCTSQHDIFTRQQAHMSAISQLQQRTENVIIIMDTLPLELFTEILGYLPPASCKSARLTSRQFNVVLAQPTFDKLRTFIDPDTALKTAQETLYGLSTRHRSVWSPNCSVPDDLPLPRSFLHAMYAALGGRPWKTATPKQTTSAARRRQLMLVDSSDESSSDESEMELLFELPPEDETEEDMTAAVMLQRLGRPELNEKMLRQALFRYALYKSYTYEGEGEAPQLWVMNTTKWKHQL
ncbi:hypothetical protein PWT90_08372 [Aphanocladium album]|nr:hypothetical protein PWT90_08372 [Aphanocladium album]